jgi:hypothetical protein
MKKWILIFLLPSTFILLQYTYLVSVFEIKKIEDIVNRQINNRSIYGAVFNSNTFQYKLLLIKKTNPEVIALGSSTVMALEEKIFSKKFINAGGAINNLDEAILFIDELKKNSITPKLLIINIDFWWFNKIYNDYDFKNFNYINNEVDNLNLETLYSFNKSLFLGQIPAETVKYFFEKKYMYNHYNNQDSLGLGALVKGMGYRHDGSYDRGNLFYGPDYSNDEQFLNTKNRIKNENARFQVGEYPDEQQLSKIEILINKIDEMKINYIILVPPIANSVFSLIDKNPKYSYIEKTFLHLEKKYEKKFLNFFNPSKSDTNNCEFIDGFHAGSNTFAKIFFNVPSELLSDLLLKKEELFLLTINNKNTAQLIENNKKKFQEFDFLNLNCNKN